MDNLEMIGRWLLILGVAIAVIGGAVWALSKVFGGTLPGTLRFQTGGITCVFPILASIVLSLVLTVVLNLVIRFLNK